ncbi:signal peptidase I [Iodobacter fluviatilis]|uniref:Signal peptidase I n=1 Tax=Iodobacter fluviatilis TaxID=537 RepID=A0A377Q6V5_9NEIS|nr:signal peptidase I [Iodobacter fluviatilis]TCU90544.1 signal peptidase I [Iodobacter fluviatilis]STQ89571.1 Signal peptidase I [Iodobacter fluviatilis]
MKKYLLLIILLLAKTSLSGQPEQTAPHFFSSKSESMEPTIPKGSLIYKEIYPENTSPKRGDIVIFFPPNQPRSLYIKRIIGLPNETIYIVNGNAKINETLIQEDYILKRSKEYISSIISNPYTSEFHDKESITLSSNQYYLLGDNRFQSVDSRHFGPITSENIVAKATLWSDIVKNKDKLHSILSVMTSIAEKKFPFKMNDNFQAQSIYLDDSDTIVTKLFLTLDSDQQLSANTKKTIKEQILNIFCTVSEFRQFTGVTSRYILDYTNAPAPIVIEFSANECTKNKQKSNKTGADHR